jgi:hypothetical protein
VVITPTVLFPAIITNTVQITNTVPPELNAADNSITQTTSIALPLLYREIGRCALTEYYDTPQGNFRIYYTRTFPNKPGWNGEQDCRVLSVWPNVNAPIPINANGYPDFVVELGAGLEQNRAHYSTQMGYSVDRIPLQNGKYPIYISSDPIWTNEPPYISDAPGVTFPSAMYIRRSARYFTAQPIDELRVVGSHELFHTFQWSYVPNACIFGVGGQTCTWAFSPGLSWWMEATAIWAEPKVYSINGVYPAKLGAFLNAPYRSLASTGNEREYGSFIFANYLEQKVANSDVIIRQIWERYRANNGGDVVAAINDVLRDQYQRNLVDEFPAFAWNNYFLNDGTYTRWIDLAYRAVDNLPQNEFRNGFEWRLFRNNLGRRDDEAGASVKTVRRFPFIGPELGDPDRVDHLGSVYIEFLPNDRTLATDLNLQIRIPSGGLLDLTDRPKVSVIPIPVPNFTNAPHPPNNFVQPTVVFGPSGSLDLLYTSTVPNFNAVDRVAVIISNTALNLDGIQYSYSATTVPH